MSEGKEKSQADRDRELADFIDRRMDEFEEEDGTPGAGDALREQARQIREKADKDDPSKEK